MNTSQFLSGSLAAPFCLVTLACSTMKVPPMTVRPAESYAYRSQTRGLTVAVNPATSKREIRATFKTDLLGKGIIPILVVAENHSPTTSFVIAKEKVVVVNNETAASATSANPQLRSSTAGDAATIAGAALGSLPLVIAGLKMASDAQVIQHNLADKALYSQTLAPGQRAQGYIYFELPKGKQFAGRYHVLLEVRDAATNKLLTFDFPIK